MYNSNMPTHAELPSAKKLFRSTVLALIGAIAILLTVILPAEYGIDPTGAGSALGLTEMGEIKQQLAEEAAQDQVTAPVSEVVKQNTTPTPTPAPVAAPNVKPVEATAPVEAPAPVIAQSAPTPVDPAVQDIWTDQVEIELTPGQGTEIKLVMDEGAVALFKWEGVQGPLNYDTHGDAKGRSISYEKGRGVRSDEGELVAAFTGNHGWFFRNRTDQNVTLVLRTGGDYKEMKRLM